MQRITKKQLHAALAFVGELNAFESLDPLAEHLLEGLPRLIECDLAGYNEVAPRRGRLHAIVSRDFPIHQSFEDAWTRHQGDHPMFQHALRTGDGGAYRFTDFMTRRAFRDTGIYADCYVRIDCEAQISFVLDTPRDVVVAFAMNRATGDFSEPERELLNLIRPGVSNAYRRASRAASLRDRADAESAALEAMGDGVLAVDASGATIAWATDRARASLARFFGADAAQDALPSALIAWAKALPLRPADAEPFVTRQPLDDGPPGRLVVRALATADGHRPLLLLLSERRVAPTSADRLRSAFALTTREAEVLLELTRGRSNPEIAAAVNCRPRTVEKHMENVFRKLEVTTRAAAVSRALASDDRD